VHCTLSLSFKLCVEVPPTFQHRTPPTLPSGLVEELSVLLYYRLRRPPWRYDDQHGADWGLARCIPALFPVDRSWSLI